MISLEDQQFIHQHESEIRASLAQRVSTDGGILIKKETGTFISRGA